MSLSRQLDRLEDRIAKRLDRFFGRILGFFFVVYRGHCDTPGCTCPNHEVVGLSRWGRRFVWIFMAAWCVFVFKTCFR